MPSLLFVDDDAQVLQGLRNRMRRHRREWSMEFVDGGHAALAYLETAPCDVIVTDMRMPEMDGLQLLRAVRDRRPDMSRIILSGQADLERAAGTIPVAHQYLAKPCPAGELEEKIRSLLDLRRLVEDPSLRALVGGLADVPTPLGAQNCRDAFHLCGSTAEAVELVRRCPTACARCLKIVNSGFILQARSILDIEEAVNYLGVGHIGLIAATAVDTGHRVPTVVSIAAIREGSAATARIAAAIHPDAETAGAAYAAGLLLDVGRSVLAEMVPIAMTQAAETARREGIPFEAAEHLVLGVGHPEIGAFLLGQWGLPRPLVQAVAHHHAPLQADATDDGTLLCTAHVAAALAEGAEPDREYLESRGVASELQTWRGIAEGLLAAPVRS